MQITDRSKDVIKSGGEWISSIDLENLAVGHPKVAEAAVIGVRHPKWDERPLLVIVLKKDQSATKEEILHFMPRVSVRCNALRYIQREVASMTKRLLDSIDRPQDLHEADDVGRTKRRAHEVR